MASEKRICADHPALQYMGRIDWSAPQNPVWVYACTCVRTRFTGSFVRAEITNLRNCWDNFLGVLIDGVQTKVKLAQTGRQVYTLGENLSPGVHELLLFKRQDACHYLQLHGLYLQENAVLSAPDPLPERRLEVYGDSVSAGEVSEAVDYCGQADPPHNGEYSNSYYSYSWFAARMLSAQLHDIAQGGIALLDETGYFHGPDYKGLDKLYGNIQYNDQIAPNKAWDFENYTPHVVVVAIGQNDNHPDDYMSGDYNHPKAVNWRRAYRDFICKLRGIYPNAHIILSTTILNHHENWDKSIHQVWQEMDDEKIHHFLYSKNGCGTHGHIRTPEAEQMGKELSAFIDSLPGVWED